VIEPLCLEMQCLFDIEMVCVDELKRKKYIC